MKQKIRNAALDDIPALKALYRDTIMVVNAVDYNTEQVRVWAETCERTDSLAKRIESQFFYVAELEYGKIVGFASFEEPDYLDMMYVHKYHQRQGIGCMLLATIREKASELGATRIVSEVSITAKPFFEKYGFHVVQEQTVQVCGSGLTNYKMVFNMTQTR
ncbi:acetyltransferase [Planctomycetales bacterium]|nr:acetyltransferase [Planctomycetales bacterium]